MRENLHRESLVDSVGKEEEKKAEEELEREKEKRTPTWEGGVGARHLRRTGGGDRVDVI